MKHRLSAERGALPPEGRLHADTAAARGRPPEISPTARDASATDIRGSDHVPVEIVGHADIPGGGRLTLARCGDQFSIQYDADELMGTVDTASETALATLAAARSPRADCRVLIGGLGMGYTLRAALAAWGPSASIGVVELVPGVVDWARGPLASVFGDSLADPRVTIVVSDVHDAIDRAAGAYDVILLDVDNGPDGFMRPENDRLYCGWGLRAARRALRPGGLLGVWSAYADDGFGPALADAGLDVEEVVVAAGDRSGADRHHIWFGRADAAVPRGLPEIVG